MTGTELFTDRRSFLLVLASLMSVGFVVLAAVPGSPGYARPGSFVAIGLTLGALAGAVLVHKVGRLGPGAGVLLLTAALPLALVDSVPGASVGRS
nr:hypothetical protein [Micromonospora sp. DSM 115978]